MKSIIMMHGLPGTGKSFIAEKIACAFPSAVVLKTVKFRVLGDSSPERFDELLPKTREEKDATYKQLILSARRVLLEGKLPVLDATFHKRYRREWVYDFAREVGAKVVIISTVCDEDVVFERLKKRESDLSKDAFLKSKESFEIMNRQAESLNEKSVLIKLVDTGKIVNFAELNEWLKNILS